MRISKSILFFLVVIIFSGCAEKYNLVETTTPVEEEEAIGGNYKYEYIIQPNDRLSIISYKFPEIVPTSLNERGVLVDSKGYVNLPLVKRVKLAGLTQPQASKKLERRYKKYLKNPTFNVEVLNKRVYVLGEVKKPGVINVDREKLTILEGIAFAGGLTDDAVRDNVLVISKQRNGKLKIRKIDLTNFDKLTSSNLLIKPDDIIYVPASEWKKFKVTTNNINSVMGAINAAASPFVLIKNLSD